MERSGGRIDISFGPHKTGANERPASAKKKEALLNARLPNRPRSAIDRRIEYSEDLIWNMKVRTPHTGHTMDTIKEMKEEKARELLEPVFERL